MATKEQKALRAAGIPFESAVVEVERLHPNPWNPNRMNDRTLEAERESIRTFGFIDPVTVRPHPEIEGDFQIIDGEHRAKVAPECGFPSVPIAILDLGETAARKLTIILNETRGEADTVLLGSLLREIEKEEGDGLGNALAFSSGELEHLLSIGDDDGWATNLGEGGLDGEDSEDDPEWLTIGCRVPIEIAGMFTEIRDQIAEVDDLDPSEKVANGQILQALIRAWGK